jgi:hypothetical protein
LRLALPLFIVSFGIGCTETKSSDDEAENQRANAIAISQIEALNTAVQSNVSVGLQGNGYVSSREFVVNLATPDAFEMLFSNSDNCEDGSWEPYATTKAWSAEENASGETNFYVQIRNSDGRTSDCTAIPVVIDLENPSPPSGFDDGQITSELRSTPRLNWQAATDNISVAG